MKIETSDIYRALRRLLEKNFKDIKVQIKDQKNPKPPCFYIKYINSTKSQTASEFESNNYSFNIIYFSEAETLQDLLTVEKTLKKILKNPLKIELQNEQGEVVNVQYQEIESISINLDEDDYILNCVADMELDQLNTEKDLGNTYFESRYDEYENNDLLEELETEI